MKSESSKLIEAFKKGTHLQMKPLDDLALTVNAGDRDIEDYEAELKQDIAARAQAALARQQPSACTNVQGGVRSLAPPAAAPADTRIRGSSFKRCPQCGAATPKGKPCSRHTDHGEADRIMRKKRRKVLFRNGA